MSRDKIIFKKALVFYLIMAMLFLIPIQVFAAPIVTEYYTTGFDNYVSPGTNHTNWAAMTFTIGTVGPNYDQTLDSVALYLKRTGSIGTVTVGVYSTVAEKPTVLLSAGSFNGATLSTTTMSWKWISIPAIVLSATTMYSIVAHTQSPTSFFLVIGTDSSAPAYTGGTWVESTNSGASWTIEAGSDVLFQVKSTIIPVAPTATTSDATGIGATNATFHGTLTSDGGEICTVKFQYGTTTAYGSTTANQTGKVTGNAFQANQALSSGQLYHFRSRVNNSAGTATGSDKSFLTYPTAATGISTIPYFTAINLTWTKGAGANRTVIRWSSTTFPPTPASGTSLYNGTGISVNHTGLFQGHTYFYSIWSFTIWGSISKYSTVVNIYKTTLYNTSTSFIINYPEYKEAGDDIFAWGTIVNMTGIPINNIWTYINLTDSIGNIVTGSSTRIWVVNGFFYYCFSTSTMIPGIYFIHSNFTQGGIGYNITRVLYLSQPGGTGHARAMVYIYFYNTNEGLGLPLESLKIYRNDTRIPYNFFESYTGEKINLKIKDYYNFTVYQNNFTINATATFLNLGLTFHSYLFGNLNTQYYMLSFLKQGATRWFERGVVPNGQQEFLLPSGNYTLRIYDGAHVELYNHSIVMDRSMVYVISGGNLSVIIAGQSVIIGQILELRTDLAYIFTPDVIIMRANPPMIYSVYDIDGMCPGNGDYLIDPALTIVATTRTETSGNWINSSPQIPTNGSISNGTITILKDELYIAGNSSITWVNIAYADNGTTIQNTTYIPSKMDLYGQNITINASENIVVKRYTKYHQVRQVAWTFHSYEGKYNIGLNVSNPMNTPLYDVYVMLELANTSNADGTTFVLRDIANNGTIMKYGEDFDVSLGCISFYLLSIDGSSSRTFTIEYRKSQSESYSYRTAEYTVNGYGETVYMGNTYHYFFINWVNSDNLIFRGILNAKLDFDNVLDIDPNSIVLKDDDNNKILSSDGVTQAGNVLTLGNSIMGDVKPGGGRSFTVYFIFSEYPGANPLSYKTTTPLFYIFGLGITLFLIGLIVFGALLITSTILFIMNKTSKKVKIYKLGAALSLFIIVLLLFAQSIGL